MNNEDLSWISACPDDFREKLRTMLDTPPGAPGCDRVYEIVMLDEFRDPNYDFTSQEEAREVAKARRQFARAWGKYAEALTARKLIQAGMPIREWNWSPKADGKKGHGTGEIDLITQEGNTIIFIEVKARCGKYGDPLDAVDEKKIRKICRGADTYLKMQRETYEYRFDVALLTGTYDDYQFEYIKDAFYPPLSTSNRR